MVELDDEDIRAIYMICDCAFRYGGLNVNVPINRILLKMPEIAEKEAKK